MSDKTDEELIKDFQNGNINDYKHFFDSKLNTTERHHILGDDRKSFYSVNEK